MNNNIDIKKIIEIGIQGMSGDNCQPWKFYWDNEVLSLVYLTQVGKHYFNRRNNAALVSIGSVIELIQQGAFLQNFETDILLTSGLGADTEEPWVQFRFKKMDAQKTNVSSVESETTQAGPKIFSKDTILKRVSHRGEHDGGELNHPVIRTIEKGFTDLPLVKIKFTNEWNQLLLDFIYLCEQSTWANPKGVKDLLPWIRTDKQDSIKNKDGLYWEELGIQPKELPAIKLLKKFPALVKPMFYLGMKKTIQSVTERNLRSSAGLMTLFTNETTEEAAVQIGRAGTRAMLYLTEINYVGQVMSSISLALFDYARGAMPADVVDPYLSNFVEGLKILQAQYGVKDPWIPAWSFRIGKCHQISKVAKSLRRDVEWFIDEPKK